MSIYDLISLIISGVALLLSIVSFFLMWLRSRKKLSIEVRSFELAGPVFYLDLDLLNKSSLPIAISQVSFEFEKKEFVFLKYPALLINKRQMNGSDVTSSERILTAKFPIKLDGFDGDSAIFKVSSDFLRDKLVSGVAIPLTITTNRGVIKKDIALPDRSLKESIFRRR